MIRNPGAVYRSTTPETHLEIVLANRSARSAAVAQMEALAEELVPGGEVYGWTQEAGHVAMSGVSVPTSDVEPPAGMRWDTKVKRSAGRVLVPAKTTPEGKALAKRMDALAHSAKPLGAVSSVLIVTDGERRWFSSAVIEVIGSDVYATYFHPLDDRRHGERPTDRDLVANDPGWTPVPLSEFYAAREAHAVEGADS